LLTLGLVPRLRDASVVKFQMRMGTGNSEIGGHPLTQLFEKQTVSVNEVIEKLVLS